MVFTKLGKVVAWITVGIGVFAVLAGINYADAADIPEAYLPTLLGGLLLKGGAIIITGIAIGIFAEISKSTAHQAIKEGS